MQKMQKALENLCPALEEAAVCAEKELLFTRAIRKIALSALSAASQLIFAHEMALPSHIHAGRFSCEHEICPQEYACEL